MVAVVARIGGRDGRCEGRWLVGVGGGWCGGGGGRGGQQRLQRASKPRLRRSRATQPPRDAAETPGARAALPRRSAARASAARHRAPRLRLAARAGPPQLARAALMPVAAEHPAPAARLHLVPRPRRQLAAYGGPRRPEIRRAQPRLLQGRHARHAKSGVLGGLMGSTRVRERP